MVLSKSQVERLALLSEEMGEAIQAIGKIVRHGYESYNPEVAETPNNRESLERELGQVWFAIELLCAVNDLSEERIDDARISKAHAVWDYLWHQETAKKLYTRRWPGTMAPVDDGSKEAPCEPGS